MSIRLVLRQKSICAAHHTVRLVLDAALKTYHAPSHMGKDRPLSTQESDSGAVLKPHMLLDSVCKSWLSENCLPSMVGAVGSACYL